MPIWKRLLLLPQVIVGLAAKSSHRANPYLSRISVGERIQRTVQRHAAPRGSQCGVVHNDRVGADRNQSLAQAVQQHTVASSTQHAPARSRNHSQVSPIHSPSNRRPDRSMLEHQFVLDAGTRDAFDQEPVPKCPDANKVRGASRCAKSPTPP